VSKIRKASNVFAGFLFLKQTFFANVLVCSVAAKKFSQSD